MVPHDVPRHLLAMRFCVALNEPIHFAAVDRLMGRKRVMKFLAGILHDPWAGLPMIEAADENTRKDWNYEISVQYYICDSCLTVMGYNMVG